MGRRKFAAMLVLGFGGCEGTGALVEEDGGRQHELARSSKQPRLPGEEAVGRRFIGLGVGTA